MRSKSYLVFVFLFCCNMLAFEQCSILLYQIHKAHAKSVIAKQHPKWTRAKREQMLREFDYVCVPFETMSQTLDTQFPLDPLPEPPMLAMDDVEPPIIQTPIAPTYETYPNQYGLFTTAFATTPVPTPEPSSLEMIALGCVLYTLWKNLNDAS